MEKAKKMVCVVRNLFLKLGPPDNFGKFVPLPYTLTPTKTSFSLYTLPPAKLPESQLSCVSIQADPICPNECTRDATMQGADQGYILKQNSDGSINFQLTF